MKPYSITRRLVSTILVVEFALAALTTAGELAYLRQQHLKALDVMLRGRADSLFGAVQDMEDKADNVFLDQSVLDLPGEDLFEVREESGALVGRSSNWTGGWEGLTNWMVSTAVPASREPIRRVRIAGSGYRAVVLHVTRNIDPNAAGPGIPHRLVVFYAVPTRSMAGALKGEAKLLALGNSLLLLLTGIAVVVVLRRGMAPLRSLAAEAAQISARSWKFQPPEESYAARELLPLATALNTALKRLEQSFRQQQTFVSDAAHELKTAVAIVKSSLQLLAYRERTVAEYQQGLDECLIDAARLEELVMKMLALASVEQAESPHALGDGRVTDLCMAVRQAVEQIKPLAMLRGVEVAVSAPAGLETTLPQADCMTVVTNLLVNAIQHSVRSDFKAGPASIVSGSMVYVVVTAQGFMVRDHGEGISSEALPFVFDRFYREDRSRARNSGGTGLGLAICKAIVERHGGKISIESERGVGTEVTVEIPGLRFRNVEELRSTLAPTIET